MPAKERLTGAIILVVLVVLVVPELLTGPRRAEPPDVETTVEGAPMRSYTIELGERSAAKPAQLRNHTAPTPAQIAAVAPAQAAQDKSETAKEEPVSEPDGEVERTALPIAQPTSEPSVTGWSIQVGTFANRENAERLTGELQRLGYRSFVTEWANGGRKLYRVRVGPERHRAATHALAERLRADRRLTPDVRKGSIVPHP